MTDLNLIMSWCFLWTKFSGEYGPHLVFVILYLYNSAVLCRGCPLLRSSKCIETMGRLIIWDLEECPL